MLVVVASRYDEIAQLLVSRWSSHNARLLTSADLSREGWRYQLGMLEKGTAVVSGEVVQFNTIQAIVTRLSAVYEQELLDIMTEDRPYVAAEMNAFLLSWLAEMPCPVLHRPTATCLSGPFWRQERWTATAAFLGIPVQPVQRASSERLDPQSMPTEERATVVTVVGRQCLGEADPTLFSQARSLAEAAQVDLLSVCFTHPERGASFVSADPWPDPLQPGLADAMLTYLLERMRK